MATKAKNEAGKIETPATQAPATQGTGKRRGRAKLTPAEKVALPEARKTARKAKAEATEALKNSAFTNAKFWKTVDEATISEIRKAMDAGEKVRKAARVAKLEKELAELKGDA